MSLVHEFVRTEWDEPAVIDDPELVDLAHTLSPDDGPEERARAARDLLRPIEDGDDWIFYGPAYTAWRHDPEIVFLTVLPGSVPAMSPESWRSCCTRTASR